MSTRDGAAPDAPQVKRKKEHRTETGKPESLRARAARVEDFAFHYNWWLSDPLVRALNRDERAGLLDVMCFTQKTSHVGVIGEEDVRVWAGYTPEEWTCHRAAFLRLFRVRPDGRWVLPMVRREYVAQLRRLRRARAAGLSAARNRWRTGGVAPAPVKKRQLNPCDRIAGGNASLLITQGNLPPVPHTDSGSRPAPPAEVLPDAAAVAGLVGLVGARLGGGGSSA